MAGHKTVNCIGAKSGKWHRKSRLASGLRWVEVRVGLVTEFSCNHDLIVQSLS